MQSGLAFFFYLREIIQNVLLFLHKNKVRNDISMTKQKKKLQHFLDEKANITANAKNLTKGATP